MSYLNKLVGTTHILSSAKINYSALIKNYLLRPWYWYLISVLITVGLGFLYLTSVQPSYDIKSKLLLREDTNPVGLDDDWFKRQLQVSSTSENVANEIQILSSFSLMKAVVEDLDLQINYFLSKQFGKEHLFHNIPVSIDSLEVTNQNIHRQSYKIVVLNSKRFELSGDTVIGVFEFDKPIKTSDSRFTVSYNGPYLSNENKTIYFQYTPIESTTEKYLRKLSVNLIDPNSSIVELSLEDEIPERGIVILSNLIEKYRLFSNRENNDITKNTLDFIEERLKEVGKDLSRAEYSLEKFKTNNNIASETTSDLGMVFEKANQLIEEQQNGELKVEILKSIKQELNARGPEDFELIPANVASINSNLAKSIDQYNTLVLDRRQMLKSAQSSHPNALTSAQNLRDLKNSISATVDNLEHELELQSTNVRDQYDETKNYLQSVPGKERQMVKIERDKSIIEELYVYMLQKREETALTLVATHSNIKIIDQPYSSMYPVSPNAQLIYILSLLAGLAIPCITISTFQLLKTSVSTKDDIQGIIPDHPIIGTINQARINGQQVVTAKDSKTWISERFRSLRTNLQFNNENKHQSILITSSVSTEGKTFIAVNLAASFASNGKKTLIIDFDLRKPKMTSYLGEISEYGLSNYLTQNMQLKAIIHESKISDHLHFISSGPIPPEPAELLKPEKLQEMFNYFKKYYDVVIVDTPPIGIVSDAMLLTRYITHSLYVVRSGFTKKEMLENAREILDSQKLTNPSLIFNAVKKLGGHSYKSYHYYN
ncbi:MAG: polysaccharide biosynthesis tyrosine autokinase [Saprospiraceae bacterium]|nr:polysaccharide biosynthesis tyrosine autokinase [Saprospiraceae bacterium]